MKAKIKGQFLENGSYHSNKTNTDVYYSTILVGATAVQIQGVQMPTTVQRLDDVEMDVNIRAYNSSLLCEYIPKE